MCENYILHIFPTQVALDETTYSQNIYTSQRRNWETTHMHSVVSKTNAARNYGMKWVTSFVTSKIPS